MPVKLSKQDIEELRGRGFSEKEILRAVRELEQEELQESYDRSNNSENNSMPSTFGTKVSSDIARWQLELNDILETAERTLRGDVVTFEGGKQKWCRNPDMENNTLNEKGVKLCMKILCMYINRNTILSDYTKEEIAFKVLDFGKRLNNLIFTKSDEMGMDIEEKRKEYAVIVGSMVDLVHSAYNRAKDGRERESYRKMISVNQASNGMGMGNLPSSDSGGQPKVRGLLNPMRYVKGKYE